MPLLARVEAKLRKQEQLQGAHPQAPIAAPAPTEEITPCAPAAKEHPHPDPTATDLDPRPDLAEDHRLWVAVLAVAWHMPDPDGLRYLHGLLHGLRCGDARLRWEQGRLRLDYKPVLAGSSDLDEAILRRDWLDPRKAQIAECFRRAAAIISKAESFMAARRGG